MEEEKRHDEETKETCGDNRPENSSENNASQPSEDPAKDANREPKPVSEEQTKKIVCSLAYLFGILFFLPLVMFPNDDTAKFHANQSLVILLATIIGEVVLGILSVLLRSVPVLGVLFGVLCGLFGLIVFVACILCIVGVINGEKKELPVIGKIRLLK